MPDTPLVLFETAQHAAETLSDPRAQSQLLAVIAQQQLSTGQFDAALQTFSAIPDPIEQRIALLVADFQSFPPEKIEPLLQLLEKNPQTKSLAGRLALTMLEAKNTASSWKLVETAEEAFESEQQRYNFLEQALSQLRAEDWAKVRWLYRTFAPGTYQDWALLIMTKYLAGQQRFGEAEKYADLLALPLRYSWTYWEMSRLSPAALSERYFIKAMEIIESMEIVSEEQETMETLARQLRIFGRAAFLKNRKDWGERLLEKSEAASTSLTMPMQRYRQQCFLGKVLVELKQIASIREYLAIDTILESLHSPLDRSRVLVWLAEAGWSEGWEKAVAAMSVPERGVAEAERVQQISNILKRCVAHHQGLQVSGDPTEDATRISGEEFDTYYFTPFAEADCGCY